MKKQSYPGANHFYPCIIVYNKHDAFALGLDSVDNKLNISLLKDNIELDLKIFLETGEEKEKQKK